MPVTLAPISRRGFIAAAAATGVGVLLGCGATRPASGRRDPNRLAIFSDIHIHADPKKLDREINMTDHLRASVDEVIAMNRADGGPSAVLINGDLAHRTGEPQDYAQMLTLLAPLVDARLPVHMGFGNHDHRENFWKGVSYEKLGPGSRVKALDKRQVLTLSTPLADIIMLDSLDKVNQTPGLLGEEQLVWLKKTLDAPGEKPIVVFMHHNPVPGSPSDTQPAGTPATTPAATAPATGPATTTSQPAPIKGTKDGLVLVNLLVPRRRVKALIWGHRHIWNRTVIEGLHCVDIPAVAYPFKPEMPSAWTDCHLTDKSIRLELHAIDRKHALHGDVADLKWRT